MKSFLDGRVVAKVGDLTLEAVDAIVNAANRTLMGGGGVDGAIHSRGGPEILAECKQIRLRDLPNGLPTGQAVITTGGRLIAKHVIHTVGPIYGQHSGNEAKLLADTYRNSLALAEANGLTTIAFPSISTGAFSYPKAEAAAVSSEAIKGFLQKSDLIREVRLVFFHKADLNVFLSHHAF